MLYNIQRDTRPNALPFLYDRRITRRLIISRDLESYINYYELVHVRIVYCMYIFHLKCTTLQCLFSISLTLYRSGMKESKKYCFWRVSLRWNDNTTCNELKSSWFFSVVGGGGNEYKISTRPFCLAQTP